ncbi:DEAD/DEAH box helicase [Sutcliffiella sp. NC1]|uniref:DEAD/DEAH box helicase n=1 Tax=Sutcliffiella sp. NC1 TaxID=3004096 RepID=UPI0022DE1BE2|nr:DEAD/DEAH box helicase [Sutcliffiella sp. NC1]WBL12883.1 DEAD/DEAH box helicase [Sutcliffiella sp. NC1]
MSIMINERKILDMCGNASFKRGEAFCRDGKVTIVQNENNVIRATISGNENFEVEITVKNERILKIACTCPKLASYKKECQHVAAVLLMLNKQYIHAKRDNNDDVDSLFDIFNSEKRHSISQRHFENREIQNATFTCKAIKIQDGQYMIGIEMKVGSQTVKNLYKFIKNALDGVPTNLSSTFTYNPALHCFSKEVDKVLQLLFEIVQVKQIYIDEVNDGMLNTLVIPPTLGEKLLMLLSNIHSSLFIVNSVTTVPVRIGQATLNLKFSLERQQNGNYSLIIDGIQNLYVFSSYQFVFVNGEFIRLQNDDCVRLSELVKMIDRTGKNIIPLSEEQLPMFIDKVVPGLRRLGTIQFSESITDKLVKTPLKAKLFLDRLKNRLLVGLEFHYENVIINPLDKNDRVLGPLFIRDVGKEEEILRIMEESEFAKTDGGYYLQNEELEYQFLYHVLPSLKKLVQIYATTAVRNRIFRENKRPKINVKMKKDRINWLQFKFEMDGIADREIKELLVALEEKRKYYRLQNGSLLSLETKEFNEIQTFLNTIPQEYKQSDDEWGLPVVGGLKYVDNLTDEAISIDKSFQQFIGKLVHPQNESFEVPEDLRSILRDYQITGYKWMKLLAKHHFGGILADDMGLGKTLQSITFISSELELIREGKSPVLIVCPSSLTFNWLSEIQKFAPQIKAIVIDGSKKERQPLLQNNSGVDVVIISYPLLRQEIQWLDKQVFHTVFFDEAQAFKNPNTQTAKAVKKVKANHRFALSGTPIENSLVELWSIFHVILPELFQSFKEYNNLTKKTISKRIRPFLLRRTKKDVLQELPQKIEQVERVELLPEQKKLYAAYLAKLRHDTLKQLDKDTIRKNRIKILAGLTRLRQICCHPALFVDGYKGTSSKFEQLKQIVNDAKRTGRRVLIFSQFTKMLQLIGKELAMNGTSFFYLDGQTPSEERLERCNRFNKGERDFFLISLKAGGTGLNLTGADTVVLYDLWWNPAVETQAADRAYRIGQTKDVQVIKLLTAGTIEEKMNELQQKKQNLVEQMIEENDSIHLTEEDIAEMLGVPIHI